jgi:hypothetical protein
MDDDVKGGFAVEGDGTDRETRARARADGQTGQGYSVCQRRDCGSTQPQYCDLTNKRSRRCMTEWQHGRLDRMSRHHRKSLARKSYVFSVVCYSKVDREKVSGPFLLLICFCVQIGRIGFMDWEVRSIPWHQRAQSLS